MHSYPKNSPDAAARVIALLLISDGHVSRSEMDALYGLDIERELGIRQPTLSQQLGEFREAGFVSTRREHKSVFYRVTEPRVVAVLNELRRIYSAAPDSLPAMRAAPAGRPRPQQAAMFGLVGSRA